MRGAVYVNGKIAPADQAVVPVYDHGFVYGEGVYETLRTYNRVPFLYDRHVRRLRQSAERLSTTPWQLDVPKVWRVPATPDGLPTRRGLCGRLANCTADSFELFRADEL